MRAKVDKDVEALKKDLSRFQNNIGNVLSDVSHYSHDKVIDTKTKLGSAMKDFSEIASNKTRSIVGGSRKLVTKKPAATIATLVALGAATTWLLKRRHHK